VAAPAELTAVTKAFGARTAVADVSFTLAPGTVTGFLGPNGAGKSTTLRMMAGLIRPTSGRVRLFGRDARLPAARRPLGYMPADPVFANRLTGRQNLDLLVRMRGAGAPDRAMVATALGLSEEELDLQVQAYSSGMRQKLAIIAALQHRPDLVVLDEPANRLDPLVHREFCAVLRSVAETGRTVLLSSHVLTEVEAVCDTVILMRQSRLLQTAAMADLRRQASRLVTLTYAAPPAHLPDGVATWERDGCTVRGRIAAHQLDTLRAAISDPAVIDVTVMPASLEDLFLDLYLRSAP
jgi:ABC-2 type transport system ATP-binding protein